MIEKRSWVFFRLCLGFPEVQKTCLLYINLNEFGSSVWAQLTLHVFGLTFALDAEVREELKNVQRKLG